MTPDYSDSGGLSPPGPDLVFESGAVQISAQPGGLVSIRLQRPALTADCARKIGPPAKGRYTPEQCLTVWRELYELLTAAICYCDPEEEWPDRSKATFFEYITFWFDPKSGAASHCAADFGRFNYDAARAFLQEEARERLGALLADFHASRGFSGSPVRPLFWCQDFRGMLRRYMEAHAESVRRGLVQTQILTVVFQEAECAWREGEPVQLLGDSRLGKTESLKTVAAMWPARFRYVAVPFAGGLRALVFEIARAVGLDTGASLERLIQTVREDLRQSGHCLLFDQSHNLFPAHYSRETLPDRLEWIISNLLDAEVPCLFMSTVQSYHGSKDRFLKKTGYAFEQWLGRVGEPVILNSFPSAAELVQVAARQLPEAEPCVPGLVGGLCIESQKGFELLPRLCARARFEARQAGRKVITSADVTLAARRCCPDFAEDLRGDGAAAATAPHRRCRPAAAGRRQEAFAAP